MVNPFKRTAFTRLIFFVATDIVVIALSFWLAFLIRFDGQIPPQYFPYLPRLILLAVFFTVPVFYIRRLYSFSWSYVSASELISLFISTTVSFALLSGAIFVSHYFPHFLNFPRSTIVVSYGLVFIFCGSSRLAKRMYFTALGFGKTTGKDRTLIVGAGDAGEQILRSMLSLRNTSYLPVGFVDDSPMKKNVKIHGLKVLGKILDIPAVARDNQIKQLIIALPSASAKTVKNVVDLGRKAGLYKIKIVPLLSEIMSGEVSLKNLKDIDVEDLLGRSPIQLDKKEIERSIKNTVVLITGAAGSIGSELARQALKFKPALLVLLDQDETGIFNIANELNEKDASVKIKPVIADIKDEEKIRVLFGFLKPRTIFHAAAYKHVPLMEAQPDEAVKNNIFGTEVLVKASVEYDVEKFIFISTDK